MGVKVGLVACISISELKSLLITHGQSAWATTYRCKALMLLIDYLARHDSAKGAPLAGHTARGYISKLEGEQPHGTVREALPLLCEIGLAVPVGKPVNQHVHLSTTYRLTEQYRKRRHEEHIDLPFVLARKFQNAIPRREKGLGRRFPHRDGVRSSLALLGFPASARPTIEKLKANEDCRPSIERGVHAIDAGMHFAKIGATGTIDTSIHCLPAQLKRLMEIDRQQVAICDVSHAHHCFLPHILSSRIDYHRKHGAFVETIAAHEREFAHLIEFLSTGDYYRKWSPNPDSDEEREKVKGLATMLLNMPLKDCENIPLYRRMHRLFPLTFRVIDDMKRRDHRIISKQTQNLMAEVMRLALLEMQERGFPAIPDTDAIICKKEHRIVACYALCAAMFTVSGGVRCKVDGIRFQTAEEIAELVAWDEEKPDGVPLTYDAWEARRSERGKALAIMRLTLLNY